MPKTLAANATELFKLFKDKFKERFDGDPLLTLENKVVGKLDSKTICITYDGNDYLLITTSEKNKNVLEELQPFLSEVMGNSTPICSYDLQNEETKEETLPTLEWDINDPEQRLKELINGYGFSSKTKLHNLTLFNGKQIADYAESEEEKAERIKNTKVYGKYPGSISDVEKIHNLDEVHLFLTIDALGGHIWRCQHDMSHGRIPQIDLTEEQYALEYMVYQTTKFGVQLDEPTPGEHIKATETYRAWYNFYSKHFKQVLTDAEWRAFQHADNSGEDTSAFMPTGKWTDSLEKPTKKEYK